MSRPQFRLSTLLWITLAVACWFGGMRVERWRTEQAERARLDALHADPVFLQSEIDRAVFEFFQSIDEKKLPPDYRDFRDEVGPNRWPVDRAPSQASPPTD
jgi:hypothetical protein